MSTEQRFRAQSVATKASAPLDDRSLLRHYEPVLRYTRGELFLPMSVESYLQRCSLWEAGGRGSEPQRLCSPGELDPTRLAEVGAEPTARNLSLRFVERPLSAREYRAWRRRPGRVGLARGGSRFAAAGLLGRLIDGLIRLSLLLRGRVPWGTTAAAEQQYSASAGPQRCPYYGHVTRDQGFVVLQYWFLYAMNDWRSTFGGVNDHEADWEQITLFLPDPPDLGSRPRWVASSSHDETGDDLRRRCDDPDLSWHGLHPVIFAGAGSHSGGYLPGDYVVRVEPPVLKGVFAGVRRLSRLVLPWARDLPDSSFGIPFVDYRRGDGLGAGPGTGREWEPVLIDDATPWVRDYQGLWGLDTGDPLGGERAPAGPRYERSGAVRTCWSDPVGWAALDKEAPSSSVQQRLIGERIAELDTSIGELDQGLAAAAGALRRARVGARALQGHGPSSRSLAASERAVLDLRRRRQELRAEREALRRASVLGLPPEDPHAHLRQRKVPDVEPLGTRRRVLRVWSAASASFLFAGLAFIVLGGSGALLPALCGLALVMLCVEAFARGRFLRFLLGVLVAAVAAWASWLAGTAALGNWRLALAAALALGALTLLYANLRDFFVNR